MPAVLNAVLLRLLLLSRNVLVRLMETDLRTSLQTFTFVVTAYWLDGPGIESQWGRDFPHLSRPALRPTWPPVNGYRVFPRSNVRPERDADPSPLLVRRSKIE